LTLKIVDEVKIKKSLLRQAKRDFLPILNKHLDLFDKEPLLWFTDFNEGYPVELRVKVAEADRNEKEIITFVFNSTFDLLMVFVHSYWLLAKKVVDDFRKIRDIDIIIIKKDRFNYNPKYTYWNY